MDKNICTKTKLAKGEVCVYDAGKIRLHAYKTNDPIDDEVFVVEQNGKAVVIESPCFFDNNRELEAYLKSAGVQPEGMLLAYHMAGGTFLPGVRKYATQNARDYGYEGGGKALIDNFASVFGAAFDASLHAITDIMEEGAITIGGIDLRITATPDAFDVEIPALGAVYTHMLGHDCHSIVAGEDHADAIIRQLMAYQSKGYSLVLSSHYTPEDLKDVQTKIDYLEDMKQVARRCSGAAEFQAEMGRRYPNYSGGNYLDMTAGFFFK